MRIFLFLSSVLIGICVIIGCSSGSNVMTPGQCESSNDDLTKLSSNLPVGVSDYDAAGQITGGMGPLGLFQMHLDSANLTGELVSLRQGMLTDVLEVVDITHFLQLAPCSDCVKLQSVSLNDNGNLVATIGIRHPFEPGDMFKPISGRNRGDLHVFNVEGIVISNNPSISFPGIGISVADFRLINASGYTGYLDNVIDDFYLTSASIHPYILHFDDYTSGNFSALNPMGFESVTSPPPTGNLVMAMGSEYHYKDYVFDFESDSIDFIFGIGCTYAVSAASKAQRFTPEFRVPQHNKKAASEVWVEIVENNLAGEDTSSSATIHVKVVDISHGVAVGSGLDEMLSDSSVSGVSVEIPGITVGSVSLPTVPLSGSGHDPSDPLIFEGEIQNSAGADEGTFMGLVKVTDSYQTGLNESPLLNGQDGIMRVDPLLNPLSGLFVIPEFSTYQVFSIDVATGIYLELIAPNGREEWEGFTFQNITWEASANIASVDIYYSHDDFVSDVNEIVFDTANTGVYEWYVPNEPSDSVKVRVIAQGGVIEDESDDFFTIIEPRCSFTENNFTLGGSWSVSNRWTYMGVKVTHQDPVQRLIMQGMTPNYNDTLFIHNADNPSGAAVALYNTGDLIYSNNNRAFWIDPISEPGIDRIIYNNYGGGSPTDGYQLKTIDWNGSEFVNPQILPKHGSIWNLCVTPEGDLISHNARTVDPTFYKRTKANNYALTTLFTLQQSTCQFGAVYNIKDIAYNKLLDAVILFCRNTDVSPGGQLFVLDMSGNLLFEDLNVFGGGLFSYNASVDVDINDPRCRIIVYAGNNTQGGPSWIARYSYDFEEKVVNEYTGLSRGPARGELCSDGTLWAAWENNVGVHRFDPPDDW